MVGSVGSTSNLINMISLSYQQGSNESRGVQDHQGPPPPSASDDSFGLSQDPLGVFGTVDSDSDGTISKSEYDILTEGIAQVTGTDLGSFLDYDSDEDGLLNGAELRSVLNEAGFAPPPPPPAHVISAYEAQSGESTDFMTNDDSLLTQLLEYLENRSGDFEITV